MHDQHIQNRTWFQRRLKHWAKAHLRDFPWRRTLDPFYIFVAEFLLQQTDAPRVVPIYHEVINRYPTVQTLADAVLPELELILKPLGLHYRAQRLSQSARRIVDEYNGQIPNSEAALLKLPGVGRYVARSICAHAFGQPLAVLDTNVARILQRFFGLSLTRARAREDPFLWEQAQEISPKHHVSHWNLILIDFGSAICTARSPKCDICPLQKRCVYAASHRSRSDLTPVDIPVPVSGEISAAP